MRRINNKGFTAVEGVAILAIVGLVALGGYYVFHQRSSQSASSTQQVAGDLTFKAPNNAYTLNYPGSWTVGDLTLAEDASLIGLEDSSKLDIPLLGTSAMVNDKSGQRGARVRVLNFKTYRGTHGATLEGFKKDLLAVSPSDKISDITVNGNAALKVQRSEDGVSSEYYYIQKGQRVVALSLNYKNTVNPVFDDSSELSNFEAVVMSVKVN